MSTDGRALLIAAGGGIGDTLLAGVVAHALRRRYAAVDALVLPAHTAVVERDPAYTAVLPFDGSPPAIARRVRAGGYAAAVVTWATAATALVPLLAGVPERVGQSRRLYSRAFTRRVGVRSERGDRTTHWTQVLLDYARALDCDDPAPRPAFVPTAADAIDAAALRRAAGIDGPYLLLHPTRGIAGVNARWPTAGLTSLARVLVARHALPVIVTGTAGDAAVAAAIAGDAGPGVVALAGKTSLGALGALAAGARGVVAMDSGPMHVAAATGAPTVGIFALRSDEPDRWAPIGDRVAVVRAAYPCPPAHRKETCPDFPCVRDLDVAGVVRALDGLLDAGTERGER